VNSILLVQRESIRGWRRLGSLGIDIAYLLVLIGNV